MNHYHLFLLFSNLQEIKFSFEGTYFKDFKELQYTTFPKLKILKIPYQHPRPEYITKFLGKNLQEFYMEESDEVLNLSIAKFCQNLKNFLQYLD